MDEDQDARATRAYHRTTEKTATLMEEMVNNAETQETIEGHDKRKLEQEVQGPTKAARSGPQPTTSVPSAARATATKRRQKGKNNRKRGSPLRQLRKKQKKTRKMRT